MGEYYKLSVGRRDLLKRGLAALVKEQSALIADEIKCGKWENVPDRSRLIEECGNAGWDLGADGEKR